MKYLKVYFVQQKIKKSKETEKGGRKYVVNQGPQSSHSIFLMTHTVPFFLVFEKN